MHAGPDFLERIGDEPPGGVAIFSGRNRGKIDRIIAALEAGGLKIAARIDHEANAKSVGLNLAPTVLLIFGNPKAGTALIEQERTVGIDLPLKILIWDDKGQIKVAYNDPAYIAHRHGLDTSLPVLTQIASTLRRLAESAVSR